MDEKIMKGMEANLNVSLRTIAKLEETNNMHKSYIVQLEKDYWVA
jgi:hypothetical protein